MHDPSPPPTRRARILLVLLMLHLAVGAVFLARGLGDVPHYPDTIERDSSAIKPPGYVSLAAEARFDPRRAPLYPLLLRAVHDVVGGPWYEGLGHESRGALPTERVRCHAPGWQTGVQVVQLLFAFAAVALCVRACLAVSPARGAALWIGAALALDPFLLHAQLALMPDGPALACCVAFLAGWIGWQHTGRLRWAALLPVSGALAAGLRPEKALVLLVATAVVTAAQLLVPALRRRVPPGRGLVVTAIAASVFLANALVVGALHERDERWSTAELVIHARVVYPHLTELRATFPREPGPPIPLSAARHYDANIGQARKVVEALSAGDPERRRDLTRRLAAHALRERPGALLWDATRDSAENLVPTVSFLVRWAWWRSAGGTLELGALKHFESMVFWFLFTSHDPWFAELALLSVACVVLVGGARALWLATRRLRASAPSAGAWTHALPVAVFLLVNACAFGFTQDLFELRYAYPGHVLVMGLAAWGLSARDRSPPTR